MAQVTLPERLEHADRPTAREAGGLRGDARGQSADQLLRAVFSRRTFERLEPYLYLLPALLSIIIWVYRPLVGTLELSVYQWNLLPTTPRIPVGLDNYRRVFTLPEMGQALWNTGIYVVPVDDPLSSTSQTFVGKDEQTIVFSPLLPGEYDLGSSRQVPEGPFTSWKPLAANQRVTITTETLRLEFSY